MTESVIWNKIQWAIIECRHSQGDWMTVIMLATLESTRQHVKEEVSEMISDKEIEAIKESLTIINDNFIKGLITALESTRTELALETAALERAVELLSLDCPCLEYGWDDDNAPQWCKDADRPSPDASIAKADCYADEDTCWQRALREVQNER